MADILLRDRNGNHVEYPGVERVKLDTADGGTQEFVDASTVPETVKKTIDLDFSSGNMEVTPEDGQAFSKVTIPKPLFLLPANICEGVNIAGIVGTLAPGGGNKDIVCKFVSFVPSSTTTHTITHDLGIVPDMVFVYGPVRTSGYVVFAAGKSTAAKNAGISFPLNMSMVQGTTMATVSKVVGIDAAGDLPISNADETTVTINGCGYSFYTTTRYCAYIIGGLT